MGRLVRKPVVPDLDLQIAGLEGVLQSDIAGMQLRDRNRLLTLNQRNVGKFFLNITVVVL